MEKNKIRKVYGTKLRYTVLKKIVTFNKHGKEKNVMVKVKKLIEKIKENELITAKAETGNTTVIMKKEEYNAGDNYI